MNVGTTADPGL